MGILVFIIGVGFVLGMVATFIMIKILLNHGCQGEFKFCKECNFKKELNKEKFIEKFDLPDSNEGIFSDSDNLGI
ncbi:MAG TPA: hypothetical protein VIK86_02140 [Candidatus Paceibacterota bacterium]